MKEKSAVIRSRWYTDRNRKPVEIFHEILISVSATLNDAMLHKQFTFACIFKPNQWLQSIQTQQYEKDSYSVLMLCLRAPIKQPLTQHLSTETFFTADQSQQCTKMLLIITVSCVC